MYAIAMDRPSVRKRLLSFIAVFILSAGTAAGRPCSPIEADRADAYIDRLTDWRAVSSMRRQFAHCDDGAIAEGISEAVARLLVDRWDTLPKLLALNAREPGLEPFILRHIDSTLDSRDLTAIARQAKNSCPRGAARLCMKLRQAAAEAQSD